MDLELIISLAFSLAIILEGIILLKQFFKTREVFTPLLFRFISNGFIYISALLVYTATLAGKSGLETISPANLSELSFGQFAIWANLIVILLSLFILLLGAVTNLGSKKETTKKIIDQKQAQDIT